MSKIITVIRKVQKEPCYINLDHVIYFVPTKSGGTNIHFANGNILEVITDWENIDKQIDYVG